MLVLLPFRYHAYLFVQHIVALLPKSINVLGLGKFMEEFGEEEEEGVKQPKWKEIFPGNNDGKVKGKGNPIDSFDYYWNYYSLSNQ